MKIEFTRTRDGGRQVFFDGKLHSVWTPEWVKQDEEAQRAWDRDKPNPLNKNHERKSS